MQYYEARCGVGWGWMGSRNSLGQVAGWGLPLPCLVPRTPTALWGVGGLWRSHMMQRAAEDGNAVSWGGGCGKGTYSGKGPGLQGTGPSMLRVTCPPRAPPQAAAARYSRRGLAKPRPHTGERQDGALRQPVPP